MRPDKSYQQLQSKLVDLIKATGFFSERRRIANQLETKFMAAWGFGPDRRRLGYKLYQAVRAFSPRHDTCVRGFDHCTFYTGDNDQRIVVTQPYNQFAADIKRDLTLDSLSAEVVEASEWGFYYPERADLFIVKFPFGFQKAMENFEKPMRQAEIEKALMN